MNEKPTQAETAFVRSQRYVLFGALFPLIWSILWGSIAALVGAEQLDDPGVKFLYVALFIHIPAFFCVLPVTGLSPMSPGNDTVFEFEALILATIPSCILYAFMGKFIAYSVNSRTHNLDQTPNPNPPPHPPESPPHSSTDNPPPAQQPPL